MKNLARDIYEYFNETTVHGFHYIATGRNSLERFFWASLIACGFIFSSLIFYHALKDWNETPLETTIEQVSLPVEELNYPAVTCLLYTSPSPRDLSTSRMPSSA